ncbi:7366_t:CDS:2 [Paraglomus brasilianum]|uniref:7366_t:CDS:1 n=1 Tax=Paraglomus brasilianum TaxID=144538 RepID=A0A9N9CFL6_9GLOM|nr:7366_t:CDS:2 [Paraglomus brasilianum]
MWKKYTEIEEVPQVELNTPFSQEAGTDFKIVNEIPLLCKRVVVRGAGRSSENLNDERSLNSLFVQTLYGYPLLQSGCEIVILSLS